MSEVAIWNNGELNHGVYHIQNDHPTLQFTIVDFSSYSESGASFIAKAFRKNLTGRKAEQWFDSLADAKQWLEGLYEKWA